MSQGRLFELLCLLLERGRMTAPQLAEHFEVSVRTIYRDIDALSAAGVPVYSTPGKGGGVSLLEGYTLHRAAFTEEEQQLLLTALRSLPGDAGQGTAETLSKLSGLFRRREPDWLQVELSRWGSAGADNAKFVQLKQAILSRRVLSFTYVGASGQTTRRSVLPARLVFKGRDWYLQGFCLERAAYRTFKLTRMLEPEPGAPFQRPLSPPPIEAGEPPEGFCIPVRLRFSPALAYRVYDEFDEGCVTRGADGSLVVSVSFPEDPWLYGYLLSFGLGVEVLEPERLRKRLALLAGKMAAHHGNHDTGCQDNCDRMESSQSQEESHMNHTFCQSCGMPIDDPALRGTERGGTGGSLYRRDDHGGDDRLLPPHDGAGQPGADPRAGPGADGPVLPQSAPVAQLMDWNAIYPGPEEPTAEQLSAYVSHPMWEPLNRWICEAYSLSPIYSYSSCSMGRGWNVKYRSGGKALCTLYPAAGAFTCLVVAPAQAEALLPTLSEYTQACWQAVKPMGSGRWLSLEVDSPEVVEDIKTLLMLKRPLKKQGQA